MEQVHIRVCNRQTLDGEEPEELLLMTEANWWEKDGATYLMYEETELTGVGTGKTMVTIRPHEVKIRRFGEGGSLMEFRPGQCHHALYNTPYGVLRLEVETLSLKADMKNRTQGSVHIQYRLMMEDSVESENDLLIEIV